MIISFYAKAHHSFKYLLCFAHSFVSQDFRKGLSPKSGLCSVDSVAAGIEVHFQHGLFTDMLMPRYPVYQCLTVSFSPSGSSCFRFSPCDLGFAQHGCLKCSWLTQQLASKTVFSKRDKGEDASSITVYRTGTVLLPCIPLFRIIRFKEVEKKDYSG